MSSWVVSKVDIDALVTVARRWARTREARQLEPHHREALVRAVDDPDAVGAGLWHVNFEAATYGGPREGLADRDPDLLVEVEDDEDFDGDPTSGGYVFEELPGAPSPGAAAKIVGCYLYQTQGDDWEESDWPERRLAEAVELVTQALAQGRSLGDLPDYESTPWGLADADRDLFER